MCISSDSFSSYRYSFLGTHYVHILYLSLICRSEEEVSKIVASCNKHKVGAAAYSRVVLNSLYLELLDYLSIILQFCSLREFSGMAENYF